jgi:hypothetical protein
MRSSGPSAPSTISVVGRAMLRLATVAALPAIVAACTLFGSRSQLVAHYAQGRATVSVGGLDSVLERIGPWGADLNSESLASLSWQGADGWFLQLTGPADLAPGGRLQSPAAALPLVSGDINGLLTHESSNGRRVASLDAFHCAVTYAVLTRTRTAGTASCHGLVWFDASSIENNSPVSDEAPFDATIEFEATGDGY